MFYLLVHLIFVIKICKIYILIHWKILFHSRFYMKIFLIFVLTKHIWVCSILLKSHHWHKNFILEHIFLYYFKSFRKTETVVPVHVYFSSSFNECLFHLLTAIKICPFKWLHLLKSLWKKFTLSHPKINKNKFFISMTVHYILWLDIVMNYLQFMHSAQWFFKICLYLKKLFL